MESTVNGMEYAGFWRRAAAWVMDILVVALPLGAVFFIFAMIYSGGNGPMEYIENQLALMRWKAIFFRAGMVVCWLYWSLMESSARQATLGKQVMGLRVVDLGGHRISFGRAAGRALVKGLLSNIFAIGYLITLFTKKSQALHDIIAGCLVLKQSTLGKSDNASLPKLEPSAAPLLSDTDSNKPTAPPPPCPSKHSSSDSLLARLFTIFQSAIKGEHKAAVGYSLIIIITVVVVLIIGLIHSSSVVSKDYAQYEKVPTGMERVYWVAKNYPDKVALWRFAGIFGNSKAAFLLGKLYDSEIIEEGTQPIGVKWYSWSAWLGNPIAQLNLGQSYLNGGPVDQDDTKALKWFRRAALQSENSAQYMMGLMNYEGRGTTRDYLEAAKWFRKAAFQGHSDAQNFLGFMYDNGHGVEENDREAAKWYWCAADQGHETAQNNLGIKYDNGEGVAQNEAAAVAMYQKAADQGNLSAWTRLKELKYYNDQSTWERLNK